MNPSSIGSTMGWEALLRGKPVINLSLSWYRKFPGIYSVENVEALTELLQKAHTLPLATKEEKLRAICALYEVSFEWVRYPVVDLVKQENVERYVGSFEVWLRDKVVAN